MARRIHKAKIKFLSLVPRGANRMQTILKADSAGNGTADFDLDLLVKGFDDVKGELTAVVYAPEQRDSQGDIASASVIKEMLYESAKDGFQIDMRHDGKPLTRSQIYVAEQFIIQKNDPRFADLKDYGGNKVDVTDGCGVVLKVLDPELISLYKSGKWNGVSMAGSALVETEKSTNDGDLDMNAAELEAILTKNNTNLMAQMQTNVEKTLEERGIKKAEVKKEGDKDAVDPSAPKLKAGASTADIRKHHLAVKRHNLIKQLDASTGDDVAYEEVIKKIELVDVEIAKASKKPGAADTDPNEGKSEREIELQKELDEIRGRSNQPVEGDNNADVKKEDKNKTTNGSFVGLEKSANGDDPAVLAALGSGMARAANACYGRK